MPREDEPCSHNVYIKGLCGNCGARLDPPQSTSVSMIHSVPELKVSQEYAKEIGKADQERLINERKLVLLVDLDQTILHTTHEEVKNDSNVHSFTLWPGHPTYFTKLRPHLKEFLDQMSKIYELHIFTFGCRRYAHKIASIIDPDQRYFGNRILSRDESVDQYSKKGNLNNLFPCGDAMVCIIDDRADVWKDAGNLIQVKAYSYFNTSISDGAYKGSASVEDEESLKRDVDKLEALLGLDDNDNDCNEASSESNSSSSSSGGSRTESKSENRHSCERNTDDVDNCDDEDETAESLDGGVKKKIKLEDRSKEMDGNETKTSETTQCSPSPLEDTDEQLLFLPGILGRIHDKWFMELDEQRRFLVEGESYKLPDIKDIIKRYLRKKF